MLTGSINKLSLSFSLNVARFLPLNILSLESSPKDTSGAQMFASEFSSQFGADRIVRSNSCCCCCCYIRPLIRPIVWCAARSSFSPAVFLRKCVSASGGALCFGGQLQRLRERCNKRFLFVFNRCWLAEGVAEQTADPKLETEKDRNRERELERRKQTRVASLSRRAAVVVAAATTSSGERRAPSCLLQPPPLLFSP